MLEYQYSLLNDCDIVFIVEVVQRRDKQKGEGFPKFFNPLIIILRRVVAGIINYRKIDIKA